MPKERAYKPATNTYRQNVSNICPNCGGLWNHLHMKCLACGLTEEKRKPETKTAVRTPLRQMLNDAIAKSKDLDLSKTELMRLTGLSGMNIQNVLEYRNVAISVADDFIVGMSQATGSLLSD